MSDDFTSLPTQRESPTQGSDAEPSLGRIDQYRLLRKLGGGGFGVVYLARDTFSGAEVALKTLHPLLKHDPEELERVRSNFLLVSRLLHPNVAAALVLHQAQAVEYADETAKTDLRLLPGEPVMVMTYAPGVPLSRWRLQFPGGLVPLARALDVARQIASALDAAHAEKIIHRDVKPGNVMVETDPDSGRLRVRVLDFGLAAEIRSSMSRISREGGDTSGTRPYMAPEQWSGRRQDGRTDQYALAALVYELLSGAPPFAGVFETGDVGIMLATVKSEEPEAVEDVPEEVNAALRKALAKTREERFATCGEFVGAMEGAGHEPAAAPGPVGAETPRGPWTPERTARFLRRRIAMQRRVESLSGDGKSDGELGALMQDARDQFEAMESAQNAGQMDAAEICLQGVEEAFAHMEALRKRREEEQRRRQEEERRRREFTVDGVTFAMVYVEPGTFQMGSPWYEMGRGVDETRHSVTLTHGYWMGETEVTQALWEKVMGANPSRFKDSQNPVEEVSWDDCQEFVAKLNALQKGSGVTFRLPTEAEWEFAARGGTKSRGTKYSGSGTLDEVAWYRGNSGGKSHPVNQKKANELGLYDMSGNVCEWCADWYGGYPTGPATDPTGPASGVFRVSRGGSWNYVAWYCRVALRYWNFPGYRGCHLGLRLAASPGL